jgi:hypothetical protein
MASQFLWRGVKQVSKDWRRTNGPAVSVKRFKCTFTSVRRVAHLCGPFGAALPVVYNPYREGVPVGGLGGTGESREITPGDSASNGRVNFEGRSVVLYTQFQSGARRITIELDTAGTNCKATVVHGRERGQNIVRRTGVGRAEVISTEVSAVSCSIKEGNVFGQ